MSSRDVKVVLTERDRHVLTAARFTCEQTLQVVHGFNMGAREISWSDKQTAKRIEWNLEFAIQHISDMLRLEPHTGFVFNVIKRGFTGAANHLRVNIDDFNKQKEIIAQEYPLTTIFQNLNPIVPMLDDVQQLLEDIMTPPATGPQSAGATVLPSGPHRR